jgi:hypothetical protein
VGVLFYHRIQQDQGSFEAKTENAHLTVERDAMAKAIARLGNEKWEMVGQGPSIRLGVKTEALYFRRPKL